MAAELVVAGAPYTVYPGGVIALRAADWMAPSTRSTLSLEDDVRSIEGEIVRDTQQVATSLVSNYNGALAEAQDTLVIDTAEIPFEISTFFRYSVFLSHLIEGDWDPADSDTYQNSEQNRFISGCGISTISDFGTMGTAGVPRNINIKRRGLENYTLGMLGGTTSYSSSNSAEVIRLRVFAAAGTTIEILLDQIIFVPFLTGTTPAGNPAVWRGNDFRYVGGRHNILGEFNLGDWVDGAEGGDDNGVFTWCPRPNLSNQQWGTGLTAGEGGGDYQKDPGTFAEEYMQRVIVQDDELILNSETNTESALHMYSAFGAERPKQMEHVNDTFSRTENAGLTEAGSSWGVTPQGFGWSILTSGAGTQYANVDGSRGHHRVGGTLGATASVTSTLGQITSRALVTVCDFDLSGKLEIEGAGQETGSGTADVQITCEPTSGGGVAGGVIPTNTNFRIRFSVDDLVWYLEVINLDVAGNWETLHTGSAFATGTEYGFRLRFDRYRIRVRVWDTGGSEPSTWDYDDFRPIWFSGTVGELRHYPYSDDVNNSIFVNENYFFRFISGHVNNVTAAWSVWWDDIVLEYDPNGDFDDVTIALERPEETEVEQISAPNSAQYFVYWGQRDYTDMDGTNGPYLAYSIRIWNGLAAADLQQARLLASWWRSIREVFIPQMWRVR